MCMQNPEHHRCPHSLGFEFSRFGALYTHFWTTQKYNTPAWHIDTDQRTGWCRTADQSLLAWQRARNKCQEPCGLGNVIVVDAERNSIEERLLHIVPAASPCELRFKVKQQGTECQRGIPHGQSVLAQSSEKHKIENQLHHVKNRMAWFSCKKKCAR